MKPINRVKQIIEHYGMSISVFEKKTGLSNNSIQTAIKRESNLKDVTLNSILIAFPEVNPIWLLNGSGNMFEKYSNTLDNYSVDEIITYIHENEENRGFVDNITYKMFLEIRTQREVIKQFEIINKRKKKELDKIRESKKN